MTNEQIAIRAVENAETAAQLEIKDPELRDSLVRNFVQELNRLTAHSQRWIRCSECKAEWSESGAGEIHQHTCSRILSVAQTVKETCIDCGKIEPCDDDCPNHHEVPANDRDTRTGAHLLQMAKSLGWLDDGEGALEFMLRRAREVAFEDCGKTTSLPSTNCGSGE